MAEFSARLGGNERPFDELLAKLVNPTPVLTELGQRLAENLVDVIEPHSKTGALEEGFSDYAIEQASAGVWTLGVGDPNILGGWAQKAPPGTIADFIRWLREKNRLARQGQVEKQAKAYSKYDKAYAKYQKSLPKPRSAIRAAARAEKSKLLGQLKTEAKLWNIENLESVKMKLARRGVSYAKQRRIAFKAVTENLGRTMSRRKASELADTFMNVFTTPGEALSMLQFRKSQASILWSLRIHVRRTTVKKYFRK